jgi:uncharacterized protein
MHKHLLRLTEEKIIRHFRESHAPIHDISLGASVGMFWALNPLVGAQMMMVTFTWAFLKSIRINMTLPIALVMVWITNPVTMPFFYYFFYILGHYTFEFFGAEIPQVEFGIFNEVLTQTSGMNLIDATIHWVRFMINDLGLPMLIGSAVIGLPVSLLTYPLTTYLVKHHRMHQAVKHNQSYEEWESTLAAKHAASPPLDLFSLFRFGKK